MSWIKVRLGAGTLRIKPRSQMRSFETEGVVPKLDLGLFVISWWSDAAQKRYAGTHKWTYKIPGGSGSNEPGSPAN
ncbi:hypothetical protein VW35_14005 [Devosia soli]|uniref:Uncharacterized protein n=1 Tax=Devosia soli TaxID=361041 RepID=A0A0F5L6A6_9HYPH|nr:hypothetical protein [Devosia soli]KKB77770.1 hypothetical protein VW35_14005 [Devosia soli]